MNKILMIETSPRGKDSASRCQGRSARTASNQAIQRGIMPIEARLPIAVQRYRSYDMQTGISGVML